MAMKETTLTKNIRMLRKKSNYRQEDVSRMLNIQRQTYSNYENASRTPPLEIVVALAELYDVSVDYLVCGKDHASGISSPALSPEEKQLLHDFADLPDHKRREVRDFIQFKKQLPY